MSLYHSGFRLKTPTGSASDLSLLMLIRRLKACSKPTRCGLGFCTWRQDTIAGDELHSATVADSSTSQRGFRPTALEQCNRRSLLSFRLREIGNGMIDGLHETHAQVLDRNR